MSITYTIPDVPLLNQLDEPTADNQTDENARMNCVFAGNAALATAYLGKLFNGDQLKDSDPRYGQGYVGGASEANLVDTMRGLGIQMTRVAGATQQDLLDTLHTEIAAGHGCIITMPSQWNSAITDPAYQPWNPRTYAGPSHVGLACGIGDGAIRVMNPWGGFWHDGTDSYWADRLLEGEVWVGTMMIPTGWKDDGKTLVAPNGVPVVRGFRDYVLNHGWAAGNYPLKPEAALDSVEPGNASVGAGSRQDFRLSSLGYTTTRGVYSIWVGQDIIALESQLAAANGHVAALEQQTAQLQQQIDPKATEALAAVAELAKALKLLGAT